MPWVVLVRKNPKAFTGIWEHVSVTSLARIDRLPLTESDAMRPVEFGFEVQYTSPMVGHSTEI